MRRHCSRELTAAADQVAAASAAFEFQESEAQDLLDRLQRTDAMGASFCRAPWILANPEAEVSASGDRSCWEAS